MEAPNAEEKREHERKREKEIKNELFGLGSLP